MIALADNVVAMPASKITVTGASIVAAIAVSGIIYWLQQRRKATDKMPTEWKPVGKVQQLYIYPLKSGRAIKLDEAECTPLGFKEAPGVSSLDNNGQEKFLLQDRFFMIYQEGSQKFLTARQKHITLLVTVKSAGPNSVTLVAPNSDDEITFKLPVADDKDDKRIQCSMHFGELINVLDCGDEVAGWLSKVIFGKDSGLRLGCYPDAGERQRSVDAKGPQSSLKKIMKDEYFGALSDIASYMILSQSSLDDLKGRLSPEVGEVTDRHFRPNIVVSGPSISAYDEDNWRWIKIGDKVVMKGFKPCTRCTMVTLDPDKGEANPIREPFVTLKKYRQVTDPALKVIEGDAPVFGRYFGLYSLGNVSVGDTVYVPA